MSKLMILLLALNNSDPNRNRQTSSVYASFAEIFYRWSDIRNILVSKHQTYSYSPSFPPEMLYWKQSKLQAEQGRNQ